MPVTAAVLLKSAKTVHQLIGYVNDGSFADSLGDIEMSAARSAFASVPHSTDKRGQVWACIGHLNSAQHAYESFIRTRSSTGILSLVRSMRDNDARAKRKFALVLKAVCYKYLGEQRLCDEALHAAKIYIDYEVTGFRDALNTIASVAQVLTCAIVPQYLYAKLNNIGSASTQYGVDNETFNTLSFILK